MAEKSNGNKDRIPKFSSFESKPEYVWLTPSQMVQKYGFSTTYWYLRRDDGTGPMFVPCGTRSILYRQDLVDEWFNSQLVSGLRDPKCIALKKRNKAAREAAKAGSKAKAKQAIGSVEGGAVAPSKRMIFSVHDWKFVPVEEVRQYADSIKRAKQLNTQLKKLFASRPIRLAPASGCLGYPTIRERVLLFEAG